MRPSLPYLMKKTPQLQAINKMMIAAIPHTVKGVYLEDLLADYTESAPINVYGRATLYATDGYVAVATDEVFDSDGRGNLKMVIALEFDGEVC